MSLRVRTQVRYTHKVRTWWYCEHCTAWGSFSTATKDDAAILLDGLDEDHECLALRVRGVSS